MNLNFECSLRIEGPKNCIRIQDSNECINYEHLINKLHSLKYFINSSINEISIECFENRCISMKLPKKNQIVLDLGMRTSRNFFLIPSNYGQLFVIFTKIWELFR